MYDVLETKYALTNVINKFNIPNYPFNVIFATNGFTVYVKNELKLNG